jgi:hypothetical protein
MTIYLASNVETFSTPRYDVMLQFVGSKYPQANIREPKKLFPDSVSWLLRWTSILHTLDMLVFFRLENETIGPGVLKEVQDALRVNIPVLLLDDDGTFSPYFRLYLRPDDRYPQFSAALVKKDNERYVYA